MIAIEGTQVDARAGAEEGQGSAEFAEDVRRDLASSPKTLSPKWLYDARGSALFELICEQPEYYPPRVETALLEAHAAEIAAAVGPDTLVFEYGAGTARKTALLLAALSRPAAYVPVDISRESLLSAAEAIGSRLPRVPVRPVLGDFTAGAELPLGDIQCARRLAFFPGSTIGNFDPPEAVALLRRMAREAGPGGALLIGVDLPKDEATLVRAYDDSNGVTAAFDLNLLARMNRELGGDLRLSAFHHRARWDPRRSRIEMHLESQELQRVHVAGETFVFEPGETLHTENAYKWESRAFDVLAALAGWRPERTWTDERAWFAVKLYRAA